MIERKFFYALRSTYKVTHFATEYRKMFMKRACLINTKEDENILRVPSDLIKLKYLRMKQARLSIKKY